MTKEFWTLVQHSGVLTGHSEFAFAVEERSACGVHLAKKIETLGGVVLDDYIEACDLAEELNYPPGWEGLIPFSRCQFTDKVVLDGSLLAIPKRKVIA